jgi:hypothetical protein
MVYTFFQEKCRIGLMSAPLSLPEVLFHAAQPLPCLFLAHDAYKLSRCSTQLTAAQSPLNFLHRFPRRRLAPPRAADTHLSMVKRLLASSNLLSGMQGNTFPSTIFSIAKKNFFLVLVAIFSRLRDRIQINVRDRNVEAGVQGLERCI